MALPEAVRVVPMVINPRGTDHYIAAIRFVDVGGATELLRIEAKYAEHLIAGIRRAVTDANAQAAQIRSTDPLERQLLTAPTGGTA